MEIRLTDANYADPVADDLVLWRYLDFPKFLDLLTSGVLKMPRASKMEDGFEGAMGIGAIKGSLAAAAERGEPSYLRHAMINVEQRQSLFWRERTYVSCWNAFPQENAGLWRIYGDDKGIVVRTTWRSLKAALTGPGDCVDNIFYGQVVYRNFAEDLSFARTYTDQFFIKRTEFEHEREFRLVAHDQSRDHNYKDHSTEGLPQFASIGCDLNVLIEEVQVSPRLGGWVRDTVEQVSTRFGGRWPVRRSSLYEPPLEDILLF